MGVGDVGINIEILQDIPPYEPKEMKQQSIAEVAHQFPGSSSSTAETSSIGSSLPGDNQSAKPVCKPATAISSKHGHDSICQQAWIPDCKPRPQQCAANSSAKLTRHASNTTSPPAASSLTMSGPTIQPSTTVWPAAAIGFTTRPIRLHGKARATTKWQPTAASASISTWQSTSFAELPSRLWWHGGTARANRSRWLHSTKATKGLCMAGMAKWHSGWLCTGRATSKCNPTSIAKWWWLGITTVQPTSLAEWGWHDITTKPTSSTRAWQPTSLAEWGWYDITTNPTSSTRASRRWEPTGIAEWWAWQPTSLAEWGWHHTTTRPTISTRATAIEAEWWLDSTARSSSTKQWSWQPTILAQLGWHGRGCRATKGWQPTCSPESGWLSITAKFTSSTRTARRWEPTSIAEFGIGSKGRPASSTRGFFLRNAKGVHLHIPARTNNSAWCWQPTGIAQGYVDTTPINKWQPRG